MIGSIPVLGSLRDQLDVIPGVVPSMIDLPKGCRFAPRCIPRVENALQICTETEPDLREVKEGHKVRCWLYYGPEKVEDPDD